MLEFNINEANLLKEYWEEICQAFDLTLETLDKLLGD